MIKLILCDDQPEHNQTLRYMLERIIKKRSLDARIALVCDTAEATLAYARRSQQGNCIYFIDLCYSADTEHPEGLKLSADLQEINPDAYVIIISAYAQYALDSFHTHAYDFLVKPFTQEQLEACLMAAIKDIRTRLVGDTLVITAGSRVTQIAQDQILYFEKTRNFVTMHTPYMQMSWRESFVSLMARLQTDMFARVHKSYLVSIRHIESIRFNTNEIVLSNGDVLPVSRRSESLLRKQVAAKG